jgi:hypothetical protein
VVAYTDQKIVEDTGREGVHSLLVLMKVVLYGHNFSGDGAVQKWLFKADRKY